MQARILIASLPLPMVFLVGPPGSGKSTLGRAVTTELGLRFVDLGDEERTDVRLEELIGLRGADVIALPWSPTREKTDSGSAIGFAERPSSARIYSGSRSSRSFDDMPTMVP